MGNLNDWLESEGLVSEESEAEQLAWEAIERANESVSYSLTRESSEDEVREVIRVPDCFDKGIWIAERDEWSFSGPHEACIFVIFFDGKVKALHGALEGTGYYVREWKP